MKGDERMNFNDQLALSRDSLHRPRGARKLKPLSISLVRFHDLAEGGVIFGLIVEEEDPARDSQ